MGYILIDGDKISAVEKTSDTKPINSAEIDRILSHALAGQYLGYRFIFLEAGSGAKKCIDFKLIEILKQYLEIPLIVGGGITNYEDIKNIKSGKPDFIVIGNFLESNNNNNELKNMVDFIHE